MEDKVLEIIGYCLPSIITGSVAYCLFNSHFKDQQNTRKWLTIKENQRHALPLKLQAYERVTLFLERIEPTKLLTRITPISTNKNDYENYVIAQIEQEFEHNLTQQIYISVECWTVIKTAKNATIQLIRKVAMSDKIDSADKLRENIINELFDRNSPSNTALAFINNEVTDLIS